MFTSTVGNARSSKATLVTLFKATACTTFAIGVLIHLGRLIMGPEAFVQKVFTPPVDVGFACLILVGAITGTLLFRSYEGGTAGRFGYGFAMLVLIGSVPIHFRTLWTWNTDYMLIFPFWYSAIEVPMFAGLAYMTSRLPFRVPDCGTVSARVAR
jgi:hypothetical protein